jgi:hypothetical protein
MLPPQRGIIERRRLFAVRTIRSATALDNLNLIVMTVADPIV